MNEEGGLRGKISRAQSGSQEPSEEPSRKAEESQEPLEGVEGSHMMENEGEEEDPRQGAVNLLLEGKMSVADIASHTGLPVSVVGGLKGGLSRKGYLTKEKPEEGPLPEAQRPLSAEEQMQKEAMRTLKEELSTAPGCSEQSVSWILRRFERDPELAHNPNQLHTLLRNTCPRMDDFIIEQVVDEVLKTVESFHLERIRAPFPNYRTRAQQGHRGCIDYGNGQMYPSAGYDQPRYFTETDVQNERKLWNIERRQDELNNFLEKTNQTLEKILEKTDKPSVPAESDSIQKLGEKIEKLESELKLKEKEMDAKDKEALRNQISELRDELKGLRGSLNDFKSDEFRLIGSVLDKGVDLGKEILREAPASKAAQQIAAALMPPGNREVPVEARLTVLEKLKAEGMTVAE